MATLLFMPWCPIDDTYEVGDVAIQPFTRNEPTGELNDSSRCQINTVTEIYRSIEGKPLENAALVAYTGKSPMDDLDEDEIDTARELTALACFSGLAKRDYFNPLGLYCNSDSFSLHALNFKRTDFVTLTPRRREWYNLSGWPRDLISITVPVHCHTIQKVSLDADLLKAIIKHRAQLNNPNWGRWQSAISCFNQANTDSDNIRYQMEWVLLCSAFEHILRAKSEAKDVATKFSDTMVPSEPLPASGSNRRPDKSRADEQAIRYEWMREFYRIRGDFAHGKLNTQQPAIWNPLEHLVLATIAFPLLVKSLLVKACKYKLTDDDQAQVDSFEKLADTADFLKVPHNQRNSLGSHWRRLVGTRKSHIVSQRAAEQAWDSLSPEQKTALGDEGGGIHDPPGM